MGGHFNKDFISHIMWNLALLAILAKSSLAFSSFGELQSNHTGLSRKRRFLAPNAASDWTFKVVFSLSFPLDGLDTSFYGELPFAFTFNPSSLGRKKRDLDEVSKPLTDRRIILENIEKYLPALVPMPPGASSHDCILRSLCEVARTPQNQDGLFGDFINLLLAPSYILDQPSESVQESDYLEAQRTGHFLQDCSRYERSCPMSLFECDEIDDGAELLWPRRHGSQMISSRP